MQLAPVRPPFVEFKRIPVDDKRRSEELGRRVTKDVDMAWIMQPGAKDRVEIKAEDWLNSLKRKSLDAAPDAMPQEWIDQFHKKYDAWKNGMDMPLNGTSIKEWPVLSPSQVQNFISIGIHTIEDVAVMTEEAMVNVHILGARELKEKAQTWLKGKDIAADLAKENNELRAKLAEFEAKLNALASQSTQTEVKIKKPGRPRKSEANME